MWERVCLPLLCLLHLPLFLSGENISTLIITTVVLIGIIYSGDISPRLLKIANVGPAILLKIAFRKLVSNTDEKISNC